MDSHHGYAHSLTHQACGRPSAKLLHAEGLREGEQQLVRGALGYFRIRWRGLHVLLLMILCCVVSKTTRIRSWAAHIPPLAERLECGWNVLDIHALADLGPVYEPGLEWGAEVSKIVSVSRASSTR